LLRDLVTTIYIFYRQFFRKRRIYLEISIDISFINIVVLARHYVVSNLFAKRDKRFAKHLLIYKYKKRLYINFLMRLSLSSKHSCNCVDINNNIKFVIQIEAYLVKINNKTKIDII